MNNTRAAIVARNEDETNHKFLSSESLSFSCQVQIENSGANLVAFEDRDSSTQRKCQPIYMAYHVNKEEMLTAINETVQCRFTFGTQNAVTCGACSECCISGMWRAKFLTDNKLLTVEIMYDAMGFLEQLSADSDRTVHIKALQVVWNLLWCSMQRRLGDNARKSAVLNNQRKFSLDAFNEIKSKSRERTFWMFSTQKGTTTNVLDPERNDNNAILQQLEKVVSTNRWTSFMGLRYTKVGREFVDFVCSYPLSKCVCVNICSREDTIFLTHQPLHMFFQ
jgi:hypothetical protein